MFNIIRVKIAARYARKAQVLVESGDFYRGLNLMGKSFTWMPRGKEYNEFWRAIRTMTTDFLVENKEILYED